MTRTLSLAALALACLALPALADAAPSTVASFGWGDALVSVLQYLAPIAATVLTTLIGILMRKFVPLASLFLTDRVVDKALTQWLDFGVNAVAGACKGKALNVDLGSAVLAQAVNRAIDRADLSKQGKALLEKAGGPAEVAAKLFRMLHLDEGGSDAILQQVLADLRAAGHLKAA